MGRHALIAIALFAGAPLAANGGEVMGTLRVRRATEEPSAPPAPVVVYVTGFQQPPPDASPLITQLDKTFRPSLLAIVAGQSVRFANDDVVVHNVFSTSKARPFDLGKPGPGQTRAVRFSTPGLVNVYCNIHEAMWANVLVLPNRAFAFVDESGSFVLRGVPPGTYPLHAWGPRIAPVEAMVVVRPDMPAQVELVAEARELNPTHPDKFGRTYRDRRGYGE